MPSIHELFQSIEADIDHAAATIPPPVHRQWPQLGQELFVLEQAQTDSQPSLTEQEKREQCDAIRHALIAQVSRDEEGYSRDTHYLAFFLVKQGRGGELVGNPFAIGKDGRKQELPYTGLEGYYAGSETTSRRPGMTHEAIIQEEANIGAELLKSLKKRAIADYSWAHFARLKHILAGQPPTREELNRLQLLWTGIVRRLHVRVYHNPEFEPTLTEKIEHVEHLLFGKPFRTEQERDMKQAVEQAYHRLRDEYDHLGTAEQEQERQERQRRARIRVDRMTEFRRFRDATYQMVAASGQARYVIGIQDASLADATITETVTLPDLPQRSTYLPVPIRLTPEQLEGYLFLAQLGEVGGDPLVRSTLVSDDPSS